MKADIVDFEILRRNYIVRNSLENVLDIPYEVREDVLEFILGEWEEMGVTVPFDEALDFVLGMGPYRPIVPLIEGFFKA